MSNNNARRQANINARKFDQLMKDIEKDVVKRTKNAKNLDSWLKKIGGYSQNPFTIGGLKSAEITKLLESIMSQAKFKGLARGGTAELVKGVISENTMHYVTRMGDDMKNNLRKIAVDSYNQGLAPQQLVKRLQEEVRGLSKTRAKAIARTETMRANNLSNYVNAKLNMGAKSYKVISANDCCDKCDQLYKNGSVWFNINDTDNLPPLHPNCRCVAVYSTKTVAENNSNINSEFDLPDDFSNESKKYIKDFHSKHFNDKIENGQIFNYKTGKPTSPKFTGDGKSVNIKSEEFKLPDRSNMSAKELKELRLNMDKYKVSYVNDKNLASIHNHPSNGLDGPSPADIKSVMSNKWEDYGLNVSKNEIWITKYNGKANNVDIRKVERDVENIYKMDNLKANRDLLSDKYKNLSLDEKKKIGSEILNKYYSEDLLKYLNNSKYGIQLIRIVL